MNFSEATLSRFALFFWCSNFCFHPELYRFLFLCIIIRFVQIWSFLSLNIKHQRHWRNKRTISLEARIIIMGGSGGMFPRKKNWNLDLRKRHILQSLDRTQLIHTYFVALFSETRYSWFPSRTDKDSWFPSFKNKDSWFLQVLSLWFMIHDSASKATAKNVPK